MTSPLDPRGRADTLSELLRILSADASDEVVGKLRARVEKTQAELVARWVQEFGDLDSGPSTPEAAAAFAKVARSRIRSALNPGLVDEGPFVDAVDNAFRLGADHAAEITAGGAPSSPVRASREMPDLTATVRAQAAQARSGLSESSVSASGYASVGVAVARSRRAVTRIDAAIAYEITRAASDGVRTIATTDGASVVWVAERDGCLNCLAYSGQVAHGDSVFSADLTFSDRPMAQREPLTGPGLHAHCRCTLDVIDPDDTAVPAALVREAKRSVLRGWADQESGPARLRAASRLLDAGAGLPKTVEARARRAVRAGTFEEGSGT